MMVLFYCKDLDECREETGEKLYANCKKNRNQIVRSVCYDSICISNTHAE